MRDRSASRTLQTLELTFEFIDILIEQNGARVTTIAEETGRSKSAICSHLHTLEQEGYVVQEGDLYHPSLKFAYVGEQTKRRDPAFGSAIDVTEEIDKEIPYISSFIIEENGLGRYLTPEIDRPARYDRFAVTGQEEYLHATAAGKSILAAFPRKKVKQIISYWGLPKISQNTITDEEELFTELDKISEQGYGVNNGESRYGVFAVAKAVNRPDGTVLGALAIASDANRIERIERNDFKERTVNLLEEYAQKIPEKI